MAELRYLKDADGNIIYPVTHTDAIIGDKNNNNEYQTITDTNLSTGNKTIVGAINEIYQNVNNGKQLIASAIGNPLITNKSTFETMSEAILGLRRNTDNEADVRETLYNMMIEDGYNNATSEMTIDELIQLLDDSQINIGDIKQVACGNSHTVILKNDGTLWACGKNTYGQLGLGDTINKNTFTQVITNTDNVKQIVCGSLYTFILKNDGTVWSCGDNEYGQLGLGNNTIKKTFTQVTGMNDVKQIACGYNHTFILKNDGTVWSCGDNEYGQLGLGNNTIKKTFTQVTTNISNVKEIVCGGVHTFILKTDGSIWATGSNEYGQLGLGSTTSKSSFTKVTTNINNDVKQIVCGDYHTIILKNDGSVWSCGNNESRQLGVSATTDQPTFTKVTTNVNNDVKQIACGDYHVIILKNDGSVWSCGNNYYDQLGLGNNTDQPTFTKVTTNVNNDVKEIICGGYFTFIIKNDGSVWNCGDNGNGELGLNDNDNRNVFTQVSLSSQAIDEYETNRQKLYYYLLDNEIPVTEDMDINTMLNLLVDDYVNNAIVGYENNLRIILADESVNVTEEDDIASLITKVDSEFDDKNNEISSLNSQIVTLQNQIDILTEELENANRPPVYDVTQDGEVIYFVNSSTTYAKSNIIETAVSVVLTEGIYRVSFDIKSKDSGWWSYGKIYIYDSEGNEIDYIGESSSKTSYQTFTNDITITGTCTVKIKYGGEWNTAHQMGTTGYMTNIKIFTHKC